MSRSPATLTLTDAQRTNILSVEGLSCELPGRDGPIRIIDDISLGVAPGETLAVVGESGSGKTMTFLAALGLLPAGGRVTAGKVMLDGVDLRGLSAEALRQKRGAEVSMVFQDPLTALNPVFTVGEQIIEVLRAHRPLSRSAARARAIELLARVHIPDPHRRIDDYPHRFSGGMRQRVLIAMAIALEPKVLIADEPTTALDVTVQAQVLELLTEIKTETRMGIVLITHDLGVVARHADRVAVLYSGRVMEQGPIDQVFAAPRHPYTVSLFRSIPHLDTSPDVDLTPIGGQPPNPARRLPGCAFEPRCYLGRGDPTCHAQLPPLEATETPTHLARCWQWRTLAGEGRPQ